MPMKIKPITVDNKANRRISSVVSPHNFGNHLGVVNFSFLL